MIAARQGHLYIYQGSEVLAVSSGEHPKIAFILPDVVGKRLGASFGVKASELVAMPMRYHHGATPT